MMANDETDTPLVYAPDSSYWSAWRTAEALESKLQDNGPLAPYSVVTRQVISVLKRWGDQWAGREDMKSFLRKTASLLHEAEESIVALHYLQEWRIKCRGSTVAFDFVAVDLCCGKGYFSMYLKYVVDMFWSDEKQALKRIILVDKATEASINWGHIAIANEDTPTGPQLELWQGENLHDTEKLLNRLESIGAPVALTGIHLCRMLSPSFLGLVNGLEECPYMCLAPCCLPRSVTKQQTDAAAGLQYLSVHRGKGSIRKTKPRPCYLCQDMTHLVRDCSLFPTEDPAECSRIRKAAAATIPCWSCGIVGHFRTACPTPDVANNTSMLQVDTRQVMVSDEPFGAYCRLLAEQCIENNMEPAAVIETGFVNEDVDLKNHQGNWNASRKSIYIIASKSRG